MEPMAAAAAAAAAWLASGLLTSCKERKDQGETTKRGIGTAHEYNFHWEEKVLPQLAHAKGSGSIGGGLVNIPSEAMGVGGCWKSGWKENILHQCWVA